MKVPKGYSRCAMCDEWYDSNNAERAKAHEHPEPQSGEPRRKWRESGLSYEDWLKTTDGEAWEEYKRSVRECWRDINAD